MKDKSVMLDEHFSRHSTTKKTSFFHEEEVLHQLKHYLPAQAPLKDFIHHNTLHAFQKYNFSQGISKASHIFGYQVSLSISEYRDLFKQNRIRKEILDEIVNRRHGIQNNEKWRNRLFDQPYSKTYEPRIGQLRNQWKKNKGFDLDAVVHPLLFRILGSYLDQGISMWSFPVNKHGLLASVRELEKASYSSFFKLKRTRELLFSHSCSVHSLLKIVVGDEHLYEHYLYDQQFAHQGWSGMVSSIEDDPKTLLDYRKISLHDLIILELLLEIDALDSEFGTWNPLAESITEKPKALFAPLVRTEEEEVISIWQEAFEWSYYDEVLCGLKQVASKEKDVAVKSFQAMFCIDDRECSIRRYLENLDPKCETFGTPGFFGVEFYYKPEHGKFYTKLCPGPVTPNYLIKEQGTREKRKKDVHFTKHSHSLFRGWLITYTLGFWSALRLFINLLRPSAGPATATSFRHMDKFSNLTILNTNPAHQENHLQVGFTLEEMAIRVENLLRSIGLIKDFAPLVYVVGHGSSSVNNPHYAAYDCGACSGRPGSVNARVASAMANNHAVRGILADRGILIPESTQFVGALHDTTSDDISFYDEDSLNPENKKIHQENLKTFKQALDYNAKERSRRFESIDTRLTAAKIHDKVRVRSVSLFEPRPELNHATNALCIVGRRELSKGLFLDRRSFMNSFDYRIDPDGTYLLGILKAVAPVCGGINLEYYFSRVDNQKLGAGTKLPHNVMGLFGVANGTDGDLRPGLPSQMIEVHDPVRLLVIVEHFPEVVLNTIQKDKKTYEWFENEWVHLVAVNPETKEQFRFKQGEFHPYSPLKTKVDSVNDITPLLESDKENFPVYLIS